MLLNRRPIGFTPEDLVFPAPQGGAIRLRRCCAINDHNFRNRAWKLVLEEKGIPYRKPYTTRHTLVSHALEKGINPVNVAELTGHNVRTLYQNYAGVIGILKLPDIFEDDP
jgi:integrase